MTILSVVMFYDVVIFNLGILSSWLIVMIMFIFLTRCVLESVVMQSE